MKLLFVVNALVFDGPTRATMTLARELRLMGHAPRIVALQRNGPAQDAAHDATGSPALILGGGSSPWALWKGCRGLRRLVQDFCPDAIIPVLAAPTVTALLSHLRSPAGEPAPLFPIHHGAHEWDERGPVLGIIVTRLMRWLLPRAKAHIVVSPHTGQELTAKMGRPLPIIVLGNPIPQAPAAMDRPTGPPWTVGGCGRLVGLKNWSTLIQAIAILRSRGIPMDAELVGDGALRNPLEQLAKDLHVMDHIRFLGHQDPWTDQARQWIAYVQPSLFESFGMAAAEAAALGLPVVHPNTGALPWTVGSAGMNYGEPTDADSLAQTLEQIIEQYHSHPTEELARRLQTSHEIRHRFDPRLLAERLLDAIRPSSPAAHL
jgi:glycosyltransferase involved in cell wall biosynthesis